MIYVYVLINNFYYMILDLIMINAHFNRTKSYTTGTISDVVMTFLTLFVIRDNN